MLNSTPLRYIHIIFAACLDLCSIPISLCTFSAMVLPDFDFYVMYYGAEENFLTSDGQRGNYIMIVVIICTVYKSTENEVLRTYSM